MHWSGAVRLKGTARVLAPVITWIGRRQEQAIWASMKRYLETPRPRLLGTTPPSGHIGFPARPPRSALSPPGSPA
jgi:hypothetical protein